MLSKCSNPSCSASFRSLEDGRLFRLGPDPIVRTAKSTPVEYYWLCKDCSSTMTLRLGEHEDVLAVVLPAPLQNIPDVVALGVADRKQGLLLQDVNSRFPKRNGNRVGSRLTNQQDVA